MIKVWTDGSSINNGKKNAKAGVGVWFGDDHDPRNVSEPLRGSEQTNNRAELTAIMRALEILLVSSSTDKEIVILSDSMYSINALTIWIKNWIKNDWKTSNKKPVKNKDLIQRIHQLMKRFPNLRFQHIKAHTTKMDPDTVGNRIADLLAINGAKLG